MRPGPPNIVAILIFILILLLIDLYVFQGVRALTGRMENLRVRRWIRWGYWILSAGVYLWLFILMMTAHRIDGITQAFMKWISVFILFLIPKLVMLSVLLAEDIGRLLVTLYNFSKAQFSDAPKPDHYSPARRQFISQIGLGLAAIPFLGILYGLGFGKFRYMVRRETLYFPDLPDAFDGFTITQFSDLHVGSFNVSSHKNEVARGVSLIAGQKSDLLLFTGDLVNNKASEMEPWMSTFSTLQAKYGKFSILGNHDYGFYIPWSEKDRLANLDRLADVHKSLGFQLMRNEHTVIEKDGQKLYLLGVEDWGKGFMDLGDIDKALEGVPADGFKVLMSHDPSHWDEIVQHHKNHVHLTLSGHTHGAQFGVEIPGIKWSPVQYRYPHWAGLYNENGKYIYVNRGFGFLALPARVGIWPEITVLTLKKGSAKNVEA